MEKRREHGQGYRMTGNALADSAGRVGGVELGECFDVLEGLVVHAVKGSTWRSRREKEGKHVRGVGGVLVTVLEEVLDLGDEQTTGVVELCGEMGRERDGEEKWRGLPAPSLSAEASSSSTWPRWRSRAEIMVVESQVCRRHERSTASTLCITTNQPQRSA